MGTSQEKQIAEKEGINLLGSPKFRELQNGRFKCVQTGHEVLEKDKESYSQSKRCRLGLIDYALSRKKPPLNMFKADPNSRSKLICNLTGDIVNKSEEHIWKHINGKQFLKKLEKMELEKESNGPASKEEDEKPKDESKPSANGVKETKEKKKKKKKKDKKRKEKKGKAIDEVITEVNDDDDNVDSGEPDFWMPPIGDRWDFDDGGDRWGSDSEPDQEIDKENGSVENPGEDSGEIPTRTKRASTEIEPSSFASKKRKSKKTIEMSTEIEPSSFASEKKKNKKNIENSSSEVEREL